MKYKCKAKWVEVWNCWDCASEMDVSMVQYIALFLAGGQAYWVLWGGEGWMFICLELQFDKVSCTFGGRDKDWMKHDTFCTNDLLLTYCLKFSPAKNHAQTE